jgi:hypothetical protein
MVGEAVKQSTPNKWWLEVDYEGIRIVDFD